MPFFALKGLIREPKPPKKGIRVLLGILEEADFYSLWGLSTLKSAKCYPAMTKEPKAAKGIGRRADELEHPGPLAGVVDAFGAFRALKEHLAPGQLLPMLRPRTATGHARRQGIPQFVAELCGRCRAALLQVRALHEAQSSQEGLFLWWRVKKRGVSQGPLQGG